MTITAPKNDAEAAFSQPWKMENIHDCLIGYKIAVTLALIVATLGLALIGIIVKACINAARVTAFRKAESLRVDETPGRLLLDVKEVLGDRYTHRAYLHVETHLNQEHYLSLSDDDQRREYIGSLLNSEGAQRTDSPTSEGIDPPAGEVLEGGTDASELGVVHHPQVGGADADETKTSVRSPTGRLQITDELGGTAPSDAIVTIGTARSAAASEALAAGVPQISRTIMQLLGMHIQHLRQSVQQYAQLGNLLGNQDVSRRLTQRNEEGEASFEAYMITNAHKFRDPTSLSIEDQKELLRGMYLHLLNAVGAIGQWLLPVMDECISQVDMAKVWDKAIGTDSTGVSSDRIMEAAFVVFTAEMGLKIFSGNRLNRLFTHQFAVDVFTRKGAEQIRQVLNNPMVKNAFNGASAQAGVTIADNAKMIRDQGGEAYVSYAQQQQAAAQRLLANARRGMLGM